MSYRATLVDDNVSSFTSSLLQGMIAVLLVVLLALGLRTGLVVASIVPITMVGSLLFMNLFGVSLNKISLAGLIVALGLLVDCSIVIVESIIVADARGEKAHRCRRGLGEGAGLPAHRGGRDDVLRALAPPTSPTIRWPSSRRPIFENVTIALFFSWFLALTVLPMLSVQFLSKYRKEKAAEKAEQNGQNGQDVRRGQRVRLTLLCLVPRLPGPPPAPAAG